MTTDDIVRTALEAVGRPVTVDTPLTLEEKARIVRAVLADLALWHAPGCPSCTAVVDHLRHLGVM